MLPFFMGRSPKGAQNIVGMLISEGGGDTK